jgi:hypothetical protein
MEDLRKEVVFNFLCNRQLDALRQLTFQDLLMLQQVIQGTEKIFSAIIYALSCLDDPLSGSETNFLELQGCQLQTQGRTNQTV